MSFVYEDLYVGRCDSSFPGNTEEDQQNGSVHHFFHVPWSLQGRLAASAPGLDIQLWQDMCIYEVWLAVHRNAKAHKIFKTSQNYSVNKLLIHFTGC